MIAFLFYQRNGLAQRACMHTLAKWLGLNGLFNDVISKEGYSLFVSKWMQKGIKLVGGCCGIITEHIRFIAQKLFSEDHKSV